MDWKEKISAEIDSKCSLLEHLAITIGENPELGLQEVLACNLLSTALEDAGFHLTRNVAGLKTAFRGTLGQGKPQIALLCEYDALPEIGHACGHNLIGAASVGAGLGLAPFLKELGGTITVLGTPAEETQSGKVTLVNAGLFDDVDAALMFHPSSQNLLMATSNALDAYEFVYLGKSAHAADSPWEGINALDGVIALFNGINAWREHLPDGARIHGIITHGGTAPNVVPARAVARFFIRAPQRDTLNKITERVLDMAKGAALMAGAEVSWNQFEPSTDNMVPNHTMALAFGANLQKLGIRDIEDMLEGRGSSDIGNVSRVVPTIHPYLSIGDGLVAHTLEFSRASVDKAGVQTALVAAKALAFTVCDLLINPSLLKAVQKEHCIR